MRKLNPNEHKLIVLVGVTKSGNTTYAVKEFPHVPRVSLNAIRLALFDRMDCNKDENQTVVIMAKAMVRSLFHAGHSTVLLDAMNLSVFYRNDWKNTNEWLREIHVMPCDQVLSLERLRQSGGSKPDSYHRRLISMLPRLVRDFQIPSQEELAEGETIVFV